jgi:hypothetical protein
MILTAFFPECISDTNGLRQCEIFSVNVGSVYGVADNIEGLQ